MSSWDAGLDMLKDELSDLYVLESDYRALVREVGMEEKKIRFIGKATTDWSNILEEAGKKTIIEHILVKARSEYPERLVLRVVERYMKLYNASRVKTWPINLDDDAKEIFECNNRVQDTMQLVICWNETIETIRNTIPDFSISPEDYISIRKLISQLEISLQKIHLSFTNSSAARSIFGTTYYEVITNLEVSQQQTNEIVTKIQEFQDSYSSSSLSSLELEETIQQDLAEIAQRLQKTKASMLVWQHQFTEGAISFNHVSANAEKASPGAKTISSLVRNEQVVPHQADETPTSNVPMNEPVSDAITIDLKQVSRGLLYQSLFLFYDTDMNGFTSMCSELASHFNDIKLRKNNLKGTKLEEKITSLLDYSEDKSLYKDLLQYIVSNVPGFQKKVSEVQSSQKK